MPCAWHPDTPNLIHSYQLVRVKSKANILSIESEENQSYAYGKLLLPKSVVRVRSPEIARHRLHDIDSTAMETTTDTHTGMDEGISPTNEE
jgi:hypothetical protein